LNLDMIENKTAAEGIAKQFVADGSYNMTPVQIDIFAKHGILPHYNECPICGDTSWIEMDFINYEGTCSYCDKLLAE